MASKKLKLEVELETAKAQRQIRDLESSKGASVGGGSVADGADDAAKSIRSLGSAANESQINLKRATRAFTGMAVGLAASYAASHMERGSKAQTAVEYGASAIQGASMGAMVAGPWGALIGGVGGLAKTYIDRSAANDAAIKDYEKSERAYVENRQWKDHFKSVTGLGEIKDYDFLKGGKRLDAEIEDVAKHLASTRAQIGILTYNISTLEKEIVAMQEAGETNTEAYRKLLADLETHRSKLHAFEGAEDALTKQEHALAVEKANAASEGYGAVFKGTDAMTKIGAGFYGGSADNLRRLGDTAKEQLSVLKEINAKEAKEREARF